MTPTGRNDDHGHKGLFREGTERGFCCCRTRKIQIQKTSSFIKADSTANNSNTAVNGHIGIGTAIADRRSHHQAYGSRTKAVRLIRQEMKSGEKKSEVSLQGPADILPLTDYFHESVSSCRGVGKI
ncbi:MAG: hypothetical protein C4B58_10630 [Deltaproteobacteria bacterium]|nr:MAG: hypothetical protein C4B58_10630 [Deltaproteobacteria bacterium]